MLFTNANWLRLSLVAIGLILIAVVVTVSLRDDAAKEDSAIHGDAGREASRRSSTAPTNSVDVGSGSSASTSATYDALSTQSPSGTVSANSAGSVGQLLPVRLMCRFKPSLHRVPIIQ